jgi:uncharacterized membrane protein
MQRMHVFFIILILALGILLTLALVSWYLATAAPSYYRSSWMGQMWGSTLGSNYGGYNGGMGGMMGNGYGNGTGTTATSYLWIIPVALIATAATAVIGVAFYFAFPELRYIKGRSCDPQNTETVPAQTEDLGTTPNPSPTTPHDSNAPTVSNSCEVLLKTMTPEEQKVLNILISHQGKYLQKYVVKEAGLSRLKTHRVVARFAQRGIVTVKEFGNTNEILLSDWVKSSNRPIANTLLATRQGH